MKIDLYLTQEALELESWANTRHRLTNGFYVWISSCKTVRIIQCEQGIQLIVQRYRTPKYRSLTYHHTKFAWASILLRWANAGGPFNALPDDPPVSVPQRFIEVVCSPIDDQDDD